MEGEQLMRSPWLILDDDYMNWSACILNHCQHPKSRSIAARYTTSGERG
jgi:hypothetical protein